MKSSSVESIASVSRWTHSMPADRSSPQTTSASGIPDTTVKTTVPSASTPRRLLVAEWAHGREPVVALEQVPKVERDADVAGEERIAAASERRSLPLDLFDRVHRECAGAIEPEVVADSPVQDEERVRVAGRAVTEPRPLGERPCAPCELAAGARELEIELVAER